MKTKSKSLENKYPPHLGTITNSDNLEILNCSFDEEKEFNNPKIGFDWVKQRYAENKEKYGKYLYETEKIQFIDTDVFKQAGLHFAKYGKYTSLHPDYDRREYDEFWDREEYRRKNGMTAVCGINIVTKMLDNGQFVDTEVPRLVWCPPKLYGYLNYCPMARRADEKDDILQDTVLKEKYSIDTLMVGYFDDIAENAVGKKIVGTPLFFDTQYHIAIAREFAKRIGKNFFYGKARRKGQSYFNAWCAFDNMDMNPDSTTILAAYDKLYLNKGDKALFNMVKACASHVYKHTDWYKGRSKDTEEWIRLGYYNRGEKEEQGNKSEVQCVSAQSNPNVTVGKDAFEIDYEELGIFPNFKDSFQVTTSTTEAGTFKTGQIVGWGTGGTKDAQWEDFEDVTYNPEAYNALACNNIFDEGAEGTAVCLFYRHIDSLEGCMDEYGNTDYEKAIRVFNKAKEEERIKASDERSFMLWCGQRANSPAEAFSRDSNNIFPGELIKKQLEFVLRNPHIKHAARYGVLQRDTNGKYKLQTNIEREEKGLKVHPPLIWDFPCKKDTDVHGCIVEYEPPFKDGSSNVPSNLYIAWQDPYAHDKDLKNLTTRDSLGATYVFQVSNNLTQSKGFRLVATLVGRPSKMDEYNEQAVALISYYNAKMLFENNIGDTKQYFQAQHKLHHLVEEPEMQFDKDVQGKTGRGYGMHMTPERRAKGAIYLRDLLTKVVGKDSQGNDMYFLQYIYDAAFLKELLKWNMQGNFDRVSSWIIGTYLIKEVQYKDVKPEKAYKKTYWSKDWF